MGRKKYHGRRVSAMIFDLDGTLIDSGLDIALSANFARGHFGLAALDEATAISYVGDGVEKLLERALTVDGVAPAPEMVAEGLGVFRDHYGRHCLDTTALYPGVLDTLLHFHRLPMMIATNKPRAFTDAILAGLHVDGAFRRVVTADEAPRKPDPAQLAMCLDGLDVAPAEVAVVGDSPNDIRAARALGAVAVGVTYGLKPAGVIRAEQPDLILTAFAELRDAFPARDTL
ncbi:HAD-IA family hydrolase [bacterium]|nr:HAD-IA family hydrolase [bacterium]MBU1072219.1 HAD-IA family hydrolase [bacterium]MBU1675411.1 HAD-IA family hydrolase [bacterium]